MSSADSSGARTVLDRAADRMLDAGVLERVGIAIASTTLALLIGLGIVALAGYNPALFANQLIIGAIGSEAAMARTLRLSTLFILTGVAVAVAFRAGVFNIGVQGQFIVGGIATVMPIVWLAPLLPSGPIAGVALIVIGTTSGIIAGGLYAALPGALKAYAGANEIITTIMLNFIAIGIVGWLVMGWFQDPNAPSTRTEQLPEYVGFPQIVFSSSSFSIIGLGITIAVVILVAIVIERTGFGYDMVTSGHQQSAATYSGVDAKRTIVATMTFSGMVAGLAGAIFVIMITGNFTNPDGISSYGFDAIAVSLLAANNPIGVIPAGLLFGGLDSAGSHIQIHSDVPAQMIDGIVGLVVLFVAAPELFRMAAARTGLGGDDR
ncbi:ABC transporter permease [Halostagnicola bangensis]